MPWVSRHSWGHGLTPALRRTIVDAQLEEALLPARDLTRGAPSAATTLEQIERGFWPDVTAFRWR